jgi:hypothetical protein
VNRIAFTASGVPAPLPLIFRAFNIWRRASKVSGVSPSLITDPPGVGQDEDPLAFVGSADVGSADTRPDRIVPERGQGPENRVNPPSVKET